MIFLGDIAAPKGGPPRNHHLPWPADRPLIGNLEGPVAAFAEQLIDRKVLFNAPATLDYLQDLGVEAVSVANNHIFDLHESIGPTQEELERRDILAFGAGDSLREAAKPVVVDRDGKRVAILGFGWEVIGCPVARRNNPGINPLTAGYVLDQVDKTARQPNVDAVVVYVHWGFEMELYPQPMHRQLARRAVEAGADLVVGTHSHRVQGAEMYRGTPIVYGLGHWYFVQATFFGGEVRFPDVCNVQLAFEWSPNSCDHRVHWFRYAPDDHTLTHLESSDFDGCERLRELTPYREMNHEQYLEFFRANRKTRWLLPVYRDIDQSWANGVRDVWVKARGRLLRFLMETGIKSVR